MCGGPVNEPKGQMDAAAAGISRDLVPAGAQTVVLSRVERR